MSNEWIKWEGGECPVEQGVLIDVKYRSGDQINKIKALIISENCNPLDASTWCAVQWGHDEGNGDIIAYRLHCDCDGCTDGDDDYPEFLKNPMNETGLTGHELDEPGDGIPEELALQDIHVLRPEGETITSEENGMDDLERLARAVHEAPKSARFGVITGSGELIWDYHCGHPIADIEAKRNDLSGKPKEWVNDWARWKAQDEDGEWWEYKEKPHHDNARWYSLYDKARDNKGEVLGDWRDTLEERVVECCCDESGPCKMHGDMQDKTNEKSAAVLTLEQLNYTYHGGQLWKPPIGQKPDWLDEDEAEWVDGLPPVGTVCDIYWLTGNRLFAGCTITYQGDGIGCYKNEHGTEFTYDTSCVEFRPIKTPKEKAIEEMDNLHEHWRQRPELDESLGEYLYRHEYRKK